MICEILRKDIPPLLLCQSYSYGVISLTRHFWEWYPNIRDAVLEWKAFSFSKWRTSARQALLLLLSALTGSGIFHSLVKVKVDEKSKCSWVRQWRKIESRKDSPGGVGHRERDSSVDPVWCQGKKPSASFTFITTLLRITVENVIYETENGR